MPTSLLVIASTVAVAVIVVARFTSANVIDHLRVIIVTPTVLAELLTFWFTGGAWLDQTVRGV